MLSAAKQNQFYKAFLDKDNTFEGTFFVGIKSTGIFCRPTCSAKKAKIENCDFFNTAQESLLAGYRPCKICRPLSLPGEMSDVVKRLVDAVEEEPSHRWCDEDIRQRGFDPSTVRRHFKNRFGMTFVAYARARRMGIALKTIRDGERVIDAQIDAGYESGSGFRDAFSKIMGDSPAHKNKHAKILKADWIETPIGPMIALCDDDALHLLEFTDRRGLEREIERLRERENIAIVPGKTDITMQVRNELEAYFNGTLKTFTVPLKIYGAEFQQSVIKVLQTVPYAETRSYGDQARILGNPKAVRAVARANGTNQIAVIIPCHRIIGADGSLTGYAGGLARKKWLLDHERKSILM